MADNQEKMAEWEKLLKELNCIGEDETIVEHIKGDYWKKEMLGRNQVRGNYFFTEKHLVFCSGFGVCKVVMPYSEIKDIKTCMISMFIPTGIDVTGLDKETGKEGTYRFSVMKRDKWISFIKEKANLA